MELQKLRELLEKHQFGHATEAERQLIDTWYASFAKHAEDDPFDSSVHKEIVRNNIWNGIPLQEVVTKKTFKLRYVIRAVSAAALVLILGVSILLKQDVPPFSSLSKGSSEETPKHIFSSVTGIKERKKLTLPDGTQIWLNATSTLHVLAGYNDSTRIVRLSGEAFFDVAYQPDKPFIVALDDLQVKVLGTAFNINSYSVLDAVNVHVERGAVLVEEGDNDLQKLTPGQSLTYDKLAGTHVLHTDRNQGSWRDGKVVLTQATFAEMAQVVLNMHGVVVKKPTNNKQDYFYDLTLYADRSLSENMDKICSIHRLKYRRVDNELILY